MGRFQRKWVLLGVWGWIERSLTFFGLSWLLIIQRTPKNKKCWWIWEFQHATKTFDRKQSQHSKRLALASKAKTIQEETWLGNLSIFQFDVFSTLRIRNPMTFEACQFPRRIACLTRLYQHDNFPTRSVFGFQLLTQASLGEVLFQYFVSLGGVWLSSWVLEMGLSLTFVSFEILCVS